MQSIVRFKGIIAEGMIDCRDQMFRVTWALPSFIPWFSSLRNDLRNASAESQDSLLTQVESDQSVTVLDLVRGMDDLDKWSRVGWT